MFDKLTPHAPKILGIFRILAGIMFACHGAQKTLGMFGGMPPGAPAWIVWGAGTIELVGGILLALGLFTRFVAFICSGTMAIAYFYGHARNGFLPKVNGGEIAVVYCWLFLYIAAAGPGSFALDNLIRRRR
ncbi:MAG TPA: DoxX family protein [Thermoanaerobaculia bacterium]|jgi:putative oxidoreductase|nr:DoxX family protein [Thermoanaerobaculia bacterium]